MGMRVEIDLYWLRHVIPGVPLAAVMIALAMSILAGPIQSQGSERMAVIEQRQIVSDREITDVRQEVKELRTIIHRQNEENAVIKSKLDQLFYVASAIAMFGLAQVGNFIVDWRKRARQGKDES